MKRFQKILVVFESEGKDRTALHIAYGLARDSGGSLTVAHVIPPLPQDVPYDLTGLEDLNRTLVQTAESHLQGIVEELPDAGIPTSTKVLWGHTAMEVTRVVLREGHDLVVKGSGTRNRISGPFLGSVDMRLLRKCPCPVWLVKPGAHEAVSSILVAVDPTTTEEAHRVLNESILQLGLSLAELEGAELHVLHAWAPWGQSLLRSRIRSEEFSGYVHQMRARSSKALTALLRPYEGAIPAFNRHLLEGDPEDLVPDFARERDIDVVLMGTVGRTGIPGFLIGNTAEMILSQVECSVLAVKPGGYVTPVELEG